MATRKEIECETCDFDRPDTLCDMGKTCPCDCHLSKAPLDSSGAIPPETWEERFKERFPYGGNVFNDELITLIEPCPDGSNPPRETTDREMVKDFIRAEIKKKGEQAESSAYERVVEVLAGMVKNAETFTYSYSDVGTSQKVYVSNAEYNSALSEAILKIKELQGKI